VNIMADYQFSPEYNDTTIYTGDVYNDVVDNICKILRDAKNLGTLNLKDIQPFDNVSPTAFPSICVVWAGQDEDEIHELGIRNVHHDFPIRIAMYYYHAQAMAAADRRELAKAAHLIATEIRTHASVLGYSLRGLHGLSCGPVNRVNDQGLVKALRFDFIVPVSKRLDRAVRNKYQ